MLLLAVQSLFCDPLLRNINRNEMIKKVTILSGKTRTVINHKACGFADDSVICYNDPESMNQIFLEYQRLTNQSGLTLNADKTEILNLNSQNHLQTYELEYKDKK